MLAVLSLCRPAHLCRFKLDPLLEHGMAARRISESCSQYEDAVRALNNLQSLASVREKWEKDNVSPPSTSYSLKGKEKLLQTAKYLNICGIKLSDLDGLNVIHVTGTKGKGSVGAMCESILRYHGLKTGFFSSPHLLEVRERIRLNGEPLSKDKFVTYFWECYSKLKKAEVDMPMYFRFLTIMSFHVFLREKTDVAVVEVGIGGAYDCTNIIPRPRVCAISSLGYDHMELLGETLEKIAWQKGGIFKQGCPAFTAPQFPSAMKVLQERALELKASSLEVAPLLAEYPLGPSQATPLPLTLGLAGEHQKVNASLAVQACQAWLRQSEKAESVGGVSSCHSNGRTELHRVHVATPFTLTQEFRNGLEQCRWPGRAQVIRKGRVTYYLDGAHTPQSLRACANWFSTECDREEGQEESGRAVRVLLFNITKKRDARLLMQALLDCKFSYAGFSPNVAFPEGSNTADQTNLTVTMDTQLSKAKQNQEAWLDITSGRANWSSVLASSREKRNGLTTSAPDPASLCSPCLPESNSHFQFSEDNARAFESICDFMQWCEEDISAGGAHGVGNGISKETLENNGCCHGPVQVLVTGSLHLVGATMTALGCRVEDL